MSFVLYYILRGLFVKLDISDKEISLEKGLLFKRHSVLPLTSVVRVTLRRTLLMRIFQAKEIKVFTLGGSIKFYLPKDEPLRFLPEKRAVISSPSFREVMFGAFIDTRALGGVFVFAAVLRRIAAVFGSEYLEKILSVLSQTADELEKALGFFRVAVPRIAVIAVVFALGAWLFAYAIKLTRLSRFRVSRNGDMLFAESGVVTLYEHALVLNSAAVIRCDTLTTILFRRAPLYLRGVMIAPCAKRAELCGAEEPQSKLASPKRAFLGHIAVPLSWFGVFSSALAVLYLRGITAALLKTVLYYGAIVNLFTAALYLLYMSRSGLFFGKELAAVCARRGLRLYTASFSRASVIRTANFQSVFQLRSGLCNFGLSLAEGRKMTVRQLPKSELLRHIPF